MHFPFWIILILILYPRKNWYHFTDLLSNLIIFISLITSRRHLLLFRPKLSLHSLYRRFVPYVRRKDITFYWFFEKLYYYNSVNCWLVFPALLFISYVVRFIIWNVWLSWKLLGHMYKLQTIICSITLCCYL